MFDEFNFETFVDVHSNIFQEYLDTVTSNLRESNPEYRAITEKIGSLYEKYPKVLAVLDMEKAVALSTEECTALIEIQKLRNERSAMEAEAIYFRGSYDGLGYLRKAGILPVKIK